MLNLDEILRYAVTREASDVHIKVGSAPVVRIDGHLERSDFEHATPAETERVAFAIMPKNRAEEFIETGEADFAHSVAGLRPLPRQRAPPARLRRARAAAGAVDDPELRVARAPARRCAASPRTRAASCS